MLLGYAGTCLICLLCGFGNLGVNVPQKGEKTGVEKGERGVKKGGMKGKKGVGKTGEWTGSAEA